MDLRQIEYVEAVARNENFTRAAEELHVAQPALSVAIRRLEAELGVRLFHRTSRRVAVTDAGAAFLTRARRVAGELDHLTAEMRDFAGGARGRLRVSSWFHVEPDMTRLVQAFVAEFPRAEVSISEIPTPEAANVLRRGDLDLAMLVLDGNLDLAGLEHVVMRTETYVLITSSDHPFTRRSSVSLAETLDLPFIATRPGTALRHCFERAYSALDAQPRVVVETNELAALVAFVSIGLGSAILPRSIVEPIRYPVAMVPFSDELPFRLAAAWAGGPHSGLVQRAIDIVVERGHQGTLPAP